MTTIAQQIRGLETLPPAALADRYEALLGKPPRVRNAAWLRRQVAWHLQANELGGLSDRARSRLDELTAQIDLPLGNAQRATPKPQRKPDSEAPLVGTTLVRRWHERDYRVEVLDNGFEWNGVTYRSLSAIAKAITGTTWNGRLFFGLTTRRPAR